MSAPGSRAHIECMSIDVSQTISDITQATPAASRVFERLGIDYCCQGKRSLRDACAARGLSLAEVVDALEQAEPPRRAAPQDPVQLIDYIESEHHAFTRAELKRLAPLADKVMRVHGASHPEVVAVHKLLAALAADLQPHMLKEERVLFPHVRGLAAGRSLMAPFPTVRAPLRVMTHEHDRVGEILRALAEVTHDYAPPPGACASYRALYDGLATLQADIHEHVHLENNVLFPAAEELEARSAARS